MVSTSSFLRLELKADDMAEFLAKKEELLADGFQEADKPVCATGIITQYFWKAPDSFVPAEEAEEEGAGGEGQGGEGGAGGEGGEGGAGGDDQQETATLTAEEAAAYNTAKGLTEGQEGYVKEGDPKPADFDTVVHD